MYIPQLHNKDTVLTGSDSEETIVDKAPDVEMACLTNTWGSADVRGVANLAEAPEWAHGIDALTIGAEVWHNLTFVNICGTKQKQNKKKNRR